MANHPSALKRERQSKSRRDRNREILSSLKTLVKSVRERAASRSSDASEVLRRAKSALDGAASKGVIHRNTASRKASRLTHLVQKSLASEGPESAKK